MIIRVFTLIACLLASQVHARDFSVDGLLEICESDNQVSRGECLGFFSGLLDTVNYFWLEEDLQLAVCFPVDMSSTRIKDISINYLKGQAKLGNFNAVVVLWPTYTRAFPCM